MNAPSRRLPPDLREHYSLNYGMDVNFSIISLELWCRDGGRITSYPLLTQDGRFSPILLEEAVVNAVADCRAHQRAETGVG